MDVMIDLADHWYYRRYVGKSLLLLRQL
jgi:hypothetical protein